MALKRNVWTLLDVILRVPPVFVMDALLNSDPQMIFPKSLEGSKSCEEEHDADDRLSSTSGVGLSFIWALFKGQAFVAALITFLLSKKRLISLYMRLLTASAILLSYKSNVQLVNFSNDLVQHRTTVWNEMRSLNVDVSLRFVASLCFQISLASVHWFLSTSHGYLVTRRTICATFLGPVVFSHLPLPKVLFTCSPELSATLAAGLLIRNIITLDLKIGETLYNGITWCHNVVEHYGLYTLLETHWLSLHIPQVFRVYWISRTAGHLFYLISSGARVDSAPSVPVNIHNITKSLMIKGSENFVAVLGMTSVVASLVQGTGQVIHSFLLLSNSEDSSLGSASAGLFMILALQTGLTGLCPEKRFSRLCRNACLLVTAILHFIHSKVNPLLLSLSASRNNSIMKHCRALGVCLFLIVFSIGMLGYLWTHQSINSWLLAVTSFTLELVINVCVSVLIYILYIVDAHRNGLWENLDDYVYYLRAFATIAEFISGIFLFFNGAWIMLFESGGTIRACMICLHAYFNIWTQARAGWTLYLKRRSAVRKISLLPVATEKQLKQLNDVCAICFQTINNARITRCNHYFHGICLRKWLNVQDSCPLCHASLSEIKSLTER